MITERAFETRIDVPGDARARLIDLLNEQLADSFDLFSQAKQAHWNVKGAEFYSLHKLFDMLAGDVAGHVDLIAERVTALGGIALGTARMAARASRLPEYDLEVTDGQSVVDALAARFASLAASTRRAVGIADQQGDGGTADMLTEISRALDKALWFLEAHNQR